MDFADLVQSAEQLTTDCDLSILSGGGGIGASALHSTALGSAPGAAAAAKARQRQGGGVGGAQGLNSIEFQQTFQQDFQQSTGHSVRPNTLLKITLNSLLKFN